jgi:hypothetical protein
MTDQRMNVVVVERMGGRAINQCSIDRRAAEIEAHDRRWSLLRGRHLLTQNARYWLVRACERNTIPIQNALFSHRQRRPIEFGATIANDMTGKLRG